MKKLFRSDDKSKRAAANSKNAKLVQSINLDQTQVLDPEQIRLGQVPF